MLSGILKCFLAVLLTCAFFASSGVRATNNAGSSGAFSSASANTYAGAVASAGAGASALSGANAFTGTFTGTGNFPDAHERHKGIRSYDNTNFAQDNDANRGIKSLSHHHGTKSGHDYNKDGDGCSKCKWENDDYWERDEPEEEGDENDGDECDDGDDGQYRPDKTHRHSGSGSRGHAPSLRPPGVHKTGPIDVYGDNVKGGVKGGVPDGPYRTTNFPTSTRYAQPESTSGYGSTPRPGSIWNTPFTGTSKPGYSGITANPFATTPSYGTSWNRGTTTDYRSTPKSVLGGEHGDTFAGNFGTTPSPTGFGGTPTATGFPSSQKPGLSWNTDHNTPSGSYGTTLRPGSNWNVRPDTPTAGFPFSQKPVPGWNAGHDNIPDRSFGTTLKPGSNWNARSGAPTIGFSPSQKPVIPWSTGRDNTPTGSFGSTVNPEQDQNTGFDSKSGLNWNPNQGTTSVGTSGCTRPDTSCSQGNRGPVKIGATPFDSGLPKSAESPSNIFPGTSHGGSGTFSPHSPPHSPSANQNGPYGQFGTAGISSAHAGAGVSSNFGSTPHGAPGFEQKEHPFGFNKPISSQAPYGNIGAHAGAGVSSNFGTTPHSGASGFEQKEHPFGFNKPISTQAPYGNIGAHAGAGITSDFGSTPYSGAPNFGQERHPFGFDKTTSTLTPYGNRPNDGLSQAHPNIGSDVYGPRYTPDYNKPGNRPITTWSSSVASTFRPESPQPGFGSSGTVPGVHDNIFSPGKSPESPIGDSIHGHPGTLKPSYGTGTTVTSPWLSTGHGNNIWPSSETTHTHAGFPVTNPSFVTTKSLGYMNRPGSFGSPYGSSEPTASKPTAFNTACCSTTANANASAFGTSFGTYNTPSITGTFVHSTPSIHTGSTNYPSVKGSFGSIRPTTGPLGTQPDGGIGVWPSKQPENSIALGGHPGSGARTWPSRKPGSGSVTTPGEHLIGNSGTWPGTKPGSGITPGGHFVIGTSPGGDSAAGSNVWPAQQPGGSGTWPSGQVGHQNGAGCSSGSCGSPTGPSSGSSRCEENYNCGGGCSGRGNDAPATHGPCSGVISGSSGVNKTYYPAGTGDGNVPNIANTYKPRSFPNIDSGTYLGINTQCGRGDNLCNQRGIPNVTPGNPVQWNPANPFLYGSAGNIPNDASRPWSGTTSKPIGKGNPFLDSSYIHNANNDRNVIPLEQENTKPFNKENPFLNDNKRRGDIEINTDERVIPLGGRKPEGSNPFGTSFGSGSSSSSGPSYGEQPPPAGSSGTGHIGGHPGRVFPQGGVYPAGGDLQGTGPLQCKFGLFGCGTAGSGSYATTKGPGNVKSGPGQLGNPGAGIAPIPDNYGSGFGIGAGHPGSGSNLAGSVGGAHAGSYAGSFSNAQASSSSFANAKSLSFSGAGGHENNFGQANSGSWSSSGAQNQGEPNSWASSGASAFASSGAGSWSRNHPVDVKG